MLLMVPLKPDGISWQTPEEKWRLVHDPVKLISVQAYTVPARLSCSQEMLSGRVCRKWMGRTKGEADTVITAKERETMVEKNILLPICR